MISNMKLLILAICIGAALAAHRRCKSGDDCEEGECCVNYAVVHWFGGICKGLAQQDESCTPLVNKNDDDPDMHHFHCPCAAGLACQADNEFNIFDHTWKHKAKCVKEGEEVSTSEEPPSEEPPTEAPTENPDVEGEGENE